MNALILAAGMVGQFIPLPPLPAYNPAGYHRRYPEYVFPVGPPVGNPWHHNFSIYALIGNVESVDRRNRRFVLRTPMERLEVRYNSRTLWLNAGHLKPGITVAVDQMTRSITFLPGQTLRQIAASVPQMRTGYDDAP